ncbi:MAG: acyl-[acyl-carrier-protein]--UDP-N-acetylglucosamine O-acyltransferase [Candidatus Dactylopiibacterium carminicum]|uniref:Acyl-[acyl-carrier-protein]--UDP-N-acetylglucosamine O-acyltransferase n=1 Tax=Candidatus Dactylopiibacterium carminicum TaxID=857335 RepID=A0A272EQD7_9RHOO|nr:acyl-ACP--UDP-N-acetylglucosamine O-acyltransferase [Candidatus Dactylopiibacterium carminicum]KAF7598552.1 acyl-ACP--UDP-N-acetylglucosamine O-acyltransferase [Candidatus Dactylopiibacterium carminicum]PAS92317.1 MAG: acyl-[acyl-carrier-protein]--UDP-N-acetylglucosamine O-acyltransferase [Candidatus Dactylopiibacterium carminicum]PAS95902.1 MAG: acyl-[acyl-carrier-protein]--UDP-N-acetylglucosamine O-acyltransferase [Candidatus Dactylopiibacterium carminicum]PAS98112.1 MAG: acyl-[acyl-carrie
MIHETAIIHPGAKIASGVEIGPYSIIGEHVEIGEGTVVASHVVIKGHTRIGRDNRIFQFVSLGEVPQDKKYAGEPTRLEIGDRNSIREYCNFNIGTIQDAGVTRIGDDNWFMASVHIGHDCQVGSNTIMANNVTLGGHVHIGDFSILGGLAAVHQFCVIGPHCMAGGGSIITQDIPPYVISNGSPCTPHGINSEGLRRRGFSAEAILAIKRAYKQIYRQNLPLDEAKRLIAEQAEQVVELRPFLSFFELAKRGIIR